MAIVGADELADLQAAAAETLDQTAIIQRATRTADDMGGQTESWSNAGTASVRVGAALFLPSEGALADRIAGRETWYLSFAGTADVRSVDRVAVGSRTFEIVGVYGPRSYEILRRVVAVETT